METPCSAVRRTSEWVVDEATSVRIDDTAVARLVGSLGDDDIAGLYTTKPFNTDIHFVDHSNPELTCQYLLVLDALNFCFWPRPQLEYDVLACGLKRSVIDSPGCISSESLTKMTEDGIHSLLEYKGRIPLAGERARLLREVGLGLEEHYEGQAVNLVRQAGGSANKLVSLITSTFPGFRDHAIYKGHQIFFFKRAQIFVGDVYGAFQGEDLGSFYDLHDLTMFADYRVPAVLREWGILRYSPELELCIDGFVEVQPGSQQEVEIRASTVVAVERLRTEVRVRSSSAHGKGQEPPPAVHIDWWLWEIGEAARKVHKPHHRALTIYY